MDERTPGEGSPNGEGYEEEGGVTLPLEWYVPESLVSRYVANMVVQHIKHGFVISFFEALPPVILGSPDEVRDQLKRMGSARATCVARLVVDPEEIPKFIQVLQESHRLYLLGQGREGDQ